MSEGIVKWFNTKKQYQGYDRTLIGGGFALLYFTIYAAYHFYRELSSSRIVRRGFFPIFRAFTALFQCFFYH